MYLLTTGSSLLGNVASVDGKDLVIGIELLKVLILREM